MKIEIKLENPECCDGCPLLRYQSIRRGCYCGIGYHEQGSSPVFVDRPQKCIKDNGE